MAASRAADRRFKRGMAGYWFVILVACMSAVRFFPSVPPDKRSIFDPRTFVESLIGAAVFALLYLAYDWVGERAGRRLAVWGAAATTFVSCLVALPDLSGSPAGYARVVRLLSMVVVFLFPIGWAYGLTNRERALLKFPSRGAQDISRREG
jgi:hypothetical protein